MRSDSENRIEKCQNLNAKLNSCEVLDSNISSFLDSSSASIQNDAKSSNHSTPGDISTHPDSASSGSWSDGRGHLRGHFRPRVPRTGNSLTHAQHSDCRELCNRLRENSNLQRLQIRAVKKMRQAISSAVRVSQGVQEEPREPVVFENAALTTLGRSNMDHTQFAIYLTRKLFTDLHFVNITVPFLTFLNIHSQELMRRSIFPKRVASRTSLSPHRAGDISKAISSRFHLDAESVELEEVFNTINQLTPDVTRGKRLKRKI